mmetsp:Transcript_13033/g.31577  ORF Transcript_13033/g.31577 Transcript_13033/m.31577 type:complete len:249 (-) Transcript_13033:887-1633(-)
MSPKVVWITAVRASDVDAVAAKDAALTISSASGFSLKTSRPPTASSASSGSRRVKRYRRVFWNALQTSVGSFSVAALVSFPDPRLRLSFWGTPWNMARRMKRSVFSTLPIIRLHRLVTRFTTLIPSSVGYSRKLPDSSNTALGNPTSSDLPISRSTARRRPKSISSRLYDSFPDRCTSLADSSDSSMTWRSLPVAKRNTRTRRSGPMVENCSPSLLISRLSALVLALARLYRSVSDLKRKSTAAVGNW